MPSGDQAGRAACAAGVTAIGLVAAYLLLARSRQLRWGATSQERDAPLPGDDLVVSPGLTATRAITVHASASQVWPWIAQLGQGRGGFYSYDFLETWPAVTSTARTASSPSGRTSKQGTRSSSPRR